MNCRNADDVYIWRCQRQQQSCKQISESSSVTGGRSTWENKPDLVRRQRLRRSLPIASSVGRDL